MLCYVIYRLKLMSHANGMTKTQWLLQQTSGVYIIAGHQHCAAVDMGKKLVRDVVMDASIPLIDASTLKDVTIGDVSVIYVCRDD